MVFDPERADMDWLGVWLTGRSLARGLPLPFKDRDGWRVEIGTASESRRWVFSEPGSSMQRLALDITDPRLTIRAIASPESMRAALPPGWEVGQPSFAMVGSMPTMRDAALPPGYRLELRTGGQNVQAFVLTTSGSLAASGHGGVSSKAFVFDRIATHPDHQRRGLGSAVMAALASTQAHTKMPQLLVATQAGRDLYLTLGWRTIAPYAGASWSAQVSSDT